MIEKDVLFFYDAQGFERDKENIEIMFPAFEDQDDLKINAKFTSSPIEFKNSLQGYKLAFIDYGGAGYGSVEALSGFFHNLVEDNPNKTFCWLLTMGREWYGNEELFSECPNVKTLDNGELFEGLPPMIKEFA
jgi:hypothetical protein